jgi:hypothetical protein
MTAQQIGGLIGLIVSALPAGVIVWALLSKGHTREEERLE